MSSSNNKTTDPNAVVENGRDAKFNHDPIVEFAIASAGKFQDNNVAMLPTIGLC